jgi:hypothetical protein
LWVDLELHEEVMRGRVCHERHRACCPHSGETLSRIG